MFIKNKSNYLVKVKIYLGELLGCESDTEAYIELRELDTKSMLELKRVSEEGEDKFIEFMKGVLPEILVSHNLYRDENNLMNKEEVTDLIFSKLDLTGKVIGEYTQQAFRVPSEGRTDKDTQSM